VVLNFLGHLEEVYHKETPGYEASKASVKPGGQENRAEVPRRGAPTQSLANKKSARSAPIDEVALLRKESA